MSDDALPICQATLSACHCRLRGPHEVHECADSSAVTRSGKCYGRWRDGGEVVRYPTGARTLAEARRHTIMIAAGRVPLPPPIVTVDL